jgi:chromatin remodeling complex protein RSC6
METTTEIETVTKVDASEQLKNVLISLTDQVSSLKVMINSVRYAIKESEKQSRELEKLRNKRTRVKIERSSDALPSGITKPVVITDELAVFLGVAPGTLVPRNEVTKGVSAYVKKHDISDPQNKQKFVLDNRPAAKTLRTLLGNPQEDVTYFNLQKYLKHHYVMNTDTASTPRKTVKDKKQHVESNEPVVAPPPPVISEPEKKKVKKIIVKKKELSEEA